MRQQSLFPQASAEAIDIQTRQPADSRRPLEQKQYTADPTRWYYRGKGLLTFQAVFTQPRSWKDGGPAVCNIQTPIRVAVVNNSYSWYVEIEGNRTPEQFPRHTQAMKHAEQMFNQMLKPWKPIARKAINGPTPTYI